MQIVINISEYNKEWISNLHLIPEEISAELADAIINGTVLPEIHGRLIDEDSLVGTGYEDCTALAPTILESNKE